MPSPTSPHDFGTDLAYSESPEVDAFFRDHFQRRFRNLVGCQPNHRNNVAQRRGIDYVLYFDNDTIRRIDAKADRHPPRNYFLEFLSVDTTNAPGWICKPLACDFIAYGFLNHNRCDFLPWHLLEPAWANYGQRWRVRYGDKEIQNRGYRAKGVAVPIRAVQAAMLEAMSQTVRPPASSRDIP